MKAGILCSAAIAIVCAASGNGVSAQVHPPHADSLASFPDTPVGRLGQELIEVINSCDSATRTAFLAGRVSEAAIKEIPIAERAAWLARVSVGERQHDVLMRHRCRPVLLGLSAPSLASCERALPGQLAACQVYRPHLAKRTFDGRVGAVLLSLRWDGDSLRAGLGAAR